MPSRIGRLLVPAAAGGLRFPNASSTGSTLPGNAADASGNPLYHVQYQSNATSANAGGINTGWEWTGTAFSTLSANAVLDHLWLDNVYVQTDNAGITISNCWLSNGSTIVMGPDNDSIGGTTADFVSGNLVSNCTVVLAGPTANAVGFRNAMNCVVQDCTLTGVAGSGNMLTGVNDVYQNSIGCCVLRCNISLTSTFVEMYQGLIQDCYLHDSQLIFGQHVDGIHNDAGGYWSSLHGDTTAIPSGTVGSSAGPETLPAPLAGQPYCQQFIIHNTIMVGLQPYAVDLTQTGAIVLNQSFGVNSDITCQNNLIAGGGYTLYGGGTTSAVNPVTNNTGTTTSGSSTITAVAGASPTAPSVAYQRALISGGSIPTSPATRILAYSSTADTYTLVQDGTRTAANCTASASDVSLSIDCTAKNITFTGNRFSTFYWPQGGVGGNVGYVGPVTAWSTDATNTWAGNVIHETGQVVNSNGSIG